MMNQHFLDYFRCPQKYATFQTRGELSEDAGFFHFGSDVACYGCTSVGVRGGDARSIAYDALEDHDLAGSDVYLPFDSTDIIENLQRERYSTHFREPSRLSARFIRRMYYLARPFLSVPVRKHMQKVHLRNWRKIPFPEWPVDTTVDRIHRKLMALAMRAHGVDKIPFIWFWPDRQKSCAIITHDVEAPAGKEFCPYLMDIDETYGFRGSFQVVPEDRYPVSAKFLDEIRSRGFEVNVHDLTHDGLLFTEREEFLRRAKKINQYGRDFGAVGFRSGALYRNADWYDALDFQYDTSIPNVAHLDPQRGGCCTVLPYCIGDKVEIPVTCTQDYTLFYILKDYSLDLWKRQIDTIRASHGLICILVHPDYVIEPREQNLYRNLLTHLAALREAGDTWAPLPREVAEWWKMRKKMELVFEDEQWRVTGHGCERACVAYASVVDGDLKYFIDGKEVSTPAHPAISAGEL